MPPCGWRLRSILGPFSGHDFDARLGSFWGQNGVTLWLFRNHFDHFSVIFLGSLPVLQSFLGIFGLFLKMFTVIVGLLQGVSQLAMWQNWASVWVICNVPPKSTKIVQNNNDIASPRWKRIIELNWQIYVFFLPILFKVFKTCSAPALQLSGDGRKPSSQWGRKKCKMKNENAVHFPANVQSAISALEKGHSFVTDTGCWVTLWLFSWKVFGY